MQLFLQPITDHYCERISRKCAQARDFAASSGIIRVGKGCELRCLLISLAS
jgi:hypothetical protein